MTREQLNLRLSGAMKADATPEQRIFWCCEALGEAIFAGDVLSKTERATVLTEINHLQLGDLSVSACFARLGFLAGMLKVPQP